MPDALGRRLRFSLRSLILFVTLAGSGVGLWAHWKPWRHERYLTGHTATVNTASFSFDGELIVTASDDGTARIWRPETGENVAVLHASSSEISDAVFTRDRRPQGH